MRVWQTACLVAALGTIMAIPSSMALAHETKAKKIEIVHPWIRSVPKGSTVTAGYVTIKNVGKKPDRLLSASLDGAAKAEIHATTIDNGVASMRRLDEGVEIAPGAEIDFAPNGMHIMFLDLTKSYDEDTYIDGTLVFEDAGKVKVEFFVEAPGKIPDHGGSSRGHDGHHKGHEGH
ncbi:MAG: copper chaperone PCu(A)C [Hyphomicrobium sp.]|nr:copper chaperone PCu(A)C [Hyphomicrobium sp.]